MAHPTRSTLSWLAAAAIIAGLGLTGCSGTDGSSLSGNGGNGAANGSEDGNANGGDGNADGPGTVKQGLHLRPGIDVHSLTVEQSALVEPNHQRRIAVLRGAAAQAVQKADAGDVLLGDGFVYRITSSPISLNDGGVEVDIARLGLAEVIWGDWDMDLPLNLEPGDKFGVDSEGNFRKVQQGLSLPSVSFDRTKLPFTLTVGFEPSGGMDLGADFKAEFEGKIPKYESSSNYECENPQVDTCVGLGFWCKQYTYCVDRLMVRSDMSADVDINFKAFADVRKYIIDKNKELVSKPLGRIPLGTTPFALYPSFYVDVGARAHAGGKAELEMNSSGSMKIPLGFEYINGEGVSGIPNSEYPVETNFDVNGDHNYEASITGGLYAEVGIQFRLGSTVTQAITIGGPRLGGELKGEAQWRPINTDPDAEPWCLKAGVYFGPKFTGELDFAVDLGVWEWSRNLGGTVYYQPEGLQTTLAEWKDDGATCPFDPNKPDSDGDGIPDEQEESEGTDPNSADTDGDDHDDPDEITQGTDPNDPDNHPGSSGHAQQCQVPANCQSGLACFGSTCVDEGQVRFSLKWEKYTDLDLHVKTPEGYEIYYRDRMDNRGGKLDVDGCLTHGCDKSKKQYVENIRWKNNAPKGTYEFWVVNYNGSEGPKPANFEIETSLNGSTKTYTGNVEGQKRAESQHWTIEFE